VYFHCRRRQSQRCAEQFGVAHLPDANGESLARQPVTLFGKICELSLLMQRTLIEHVFNTVARADSIRGHLHHQQTAVHEARAGQPLGTQGLCVETDGSDLQKLQHVDKQHPNKDDERIWQSAPKRKNPSCNFIRCNRR
jgi:hypothetical protein